MRLLLLLLFFTGIILVLANQVLNAPLVKVEYKYLPRDLDTYIREDTKASAHFDSMFNQDELWLTGLHSAASYPAADKAS